MERTYTNPDFLAAMFGIDAEDMEAQAACRRLEDERLRLEAELQRYKTAFGPLRSAPPQQLDLLAPRPGGARRSDPATSKAAATGPARIRWGTHRHALLRTFSYEPDRGLSDEQAASFCGRAMPGYWKRCAELRAAGWIEPTGRTVESSAGEQVMVCRITEAGQAALRAVKHPDANLR